MMGGGSVPGGWLPEMQLKCCSGAGKKDHMSAVLIDLRESVLSDVWEGAESETKFRGPREAPERERDRERETERETERERERDLSFL